MNDSSGGTTETGAPSSEADENQTADAAREPLLSTRIAVALAIASGVLTGLSHPLVIKALGSGAVDKTGLTGLLALVGIVPLLLATQGRTPGRAYGLAFLAAWIHFVVTAHWLVVAFSHFGGLPFVAGVTAMLVVTAGVAIFPAVAIAAANLIESKLGWSRVWVFPFTLAAAELLRDFMPFQGVPWAHAGIALGTVSVLAQSAAVVGVFGLVVFAGLCNSVIAQTIVDRTRGAPLSTRPLIVAGVTLLVVIGYGAMRLQTAPIPDGTPTIKVALLQASIDQNTLNTAGNKTSLAIRTEYHELQEEALAKDADLVIWPEAALRPGALGDETDLGRAGALRKEQWQMGEAARLDFAPKAAIVGAVTFVPKPNLVTGRIENTLYTSAYATGPGFSVLGRWDKVNLLPFGEYIPFPLRGLIKAFVHVGGNLVLGENHNVIEMPIAGRQVKVGATICYEGVFSGVSREMVNEGADLLVNISNDAWYGTSSEMEQHLVHYRLRSIETGRVYARAANSGISAWIDGRGRVWSATKRGERVALVTDVPLLDETTPVRILGDWLGVLALLFTVVASWMAIVGIKPSVAQSLTSLPRLETAILVGALVAIPTLLALSAWAPVNEGMRTMADMGAVALAWAAICVAPNVDVSMWFRRLGLALMLSWGVLCAMGAVFVHIVSGGFVVVALGLAYVLFVRMRQPAMAKPELANNAQDA